MKNCARLIRLRADCEIREKVKPDSVPNAAAIAENKAMDSALPMCGQLGMTAPKYKTHPNMTLPLLGDSDKRQTRLETTSQQPKSQAMRPRPAQATVACFQRLGRWTNIASPLARSIELRPSWSEANGYKIPKHGRRPQGRR